MTARLVAVATMAAAALVAVPVTASAHDPGALSLESLSSTAQLESGERLVVDLESGADNSEVVEKLEDATSGTLASYIDSDTVVLNVPGKADASEVDDVLTVEGVATASPEVLFRAQLTPNDPCVTSCFNGLSQWYLSNVRSSQAWDATTGSSSIRIAVLDTGVNASHPDLSGKVDVGTSFAPGNLGCGGSVVDHGTHVAGIAAAATNNGTGIAGIGYNTRVLSVKVLDDRGCGNEGTIAPGITYAADQANVKIINMSLGGSSYSSAVASAVAYAQSKGILVIAAAGNDGTTTQTYPAALDGVIAVASTGQSDGISSFSNRGSWVDMAAPGESILSTYVSGGSNTYAIGDGTSAAAPMVSGVAALVWAANPGFNANDVAYRILSQSDPISGTGSSIQYGRLDAGGAVNPENTGYWLVGSDGGIFTFGYAAFFGSTGNLSLNKPVVGMASTLSGNGYWFVASDGGIFSYGDAPFFGSTGAIALNKPIVGMARTPSGNGYWLVASDGGLFAFGDAKFFGSTGGIKLNKPVVGMAPTKFGNGYWLVASDGGIFSFGDAPFYGSTGNITLNQPIIGMAATSSGSGYWFVAADGGLFAYGNAGFHGSLGGAAISAPVTAFAAATQGSGYWMALSNGSVYGFGSASFQGQIGGLKAPVVGMAARPL